MRTVLITGASRGIGQQAAFDFLEAGYNVVVNYNQTYINEADYLPYKDHVIFIKADIADYSQVQKMFVDASNQFGNIDVVINNAAVTYLGLLSQMDEKDWDRLMDIN